MACKFKRALAKNTIEQFKLVTDKIDAFGSGAIDL